MDDRTLKELLGAAWAEWDRARADREGATVVPANSAPVLWFGPSRAYVASRRRVLTLGVNPGPLTFPGENPWAGLPAWAPPADTRNTAIYQAGCDAYPVRHGVHARWFGSWDSLISPLGASWAPGFDTPLHVDLSPIATSERFSTLSTDFRRSLRSNGMAILKPLVQMFDPQVTVASLALEHFDAMRNGLSVVAHTRIPTSHGEAWICDWALPGALVWVRKTNRAPVDFGNKEKAAIGIWVREWLDKPSAGPDREPRGAVGLARALGGAGLAPTIADVVADMQAAFPGGWQEGTPSGALPHWHPQGTGFGWARRIRFRAPDGRLAELSTTAKPERVREFLQDWHEHHAEMVAGAWGEHPSKTAVHISFSVGGQMKHYAGLYFRWVMQ